MGTWAEWGAQRAVQSPQVLQQLMLTLALTLVLMLMLV